MPDEISHSPTPAKKDLAYRPIEVKMNFTQAVNAIVDGRKVHKLEWQDREYYGILNDATLMLHKPDNKLYAWIVSEGDIVGTDYIVI